MLWLNLYGSPSNLDKRPNFSFISLVYLDSSDVCNDIGFNLGAVDTVTSSWSIKVRTSFVSKPFQCHGLVLFFN